MNEEIYFELTVALDNQMADIYGINQIENMLGVSLTVNEDENCYGCPFSSVAQIKESGKRIYSDEMIEKGYLAWRELIEYDGSIYAPDSGAGYISSYDDIVNVVITKQTDDNIEFEVYFDVSENDIAFTSLYSVVYEDNHWVINDIA